MLPADLSAGPSPPAIPDPLIEPHKGEGVGVRARSISAGPLTEPPTRYTPALTAPTRPPK